MVEAKIKKSHYSCKDCALQRACRFIGCVKREIDVKIPGAAIISCNDEHEVRVIPVTDETNYNQDI